jgi:hypothetical protein
MEATLIAVISVALGLAVLAMGTRLAGRAARSADDRAAETVVPDREFRRATGHGHRGMTFPRQADISRAEAS